MLAVLVAVGNLVVCAAVLAAVTRSAAPTAGFTRVAGPDGMTAHVPAGWPVTSAAEPGALRVDDPAGTSTRLWFGSAAPTREDVYAERADCARRLAEARDGYAQLRLERTVVRGAPAVDWEYEYDAAEGRRHVRSVHWRHDGREYFVRASAPTRLWPDAGEALDVMLAHSTP
ncbi:hypothetical protein [Actinophytocola sp. NPDC049390]|uniref:hypothetical protein n=1 Tax=Actinophytocola sp. NPDC049390 TaxID=3363894 RepID=UPI0037A9840D